MPRIGVSGASGDLGKRITRALLDRVPPDQITLVSRTPEALQSHLAEGVAVRYGDFREPKTLVPAYRGVEVLMLISGVNVHSRIGEHRQAIAAARRAGVRHIIYTSVTGMHPANPAISVTDHAATEQDVQQSGLGYTILRNAAYSEVFLSGAVRPVIESGAWIQVAGNGRFAPVSKDDIAGCAAAILVSPEAHDGAVYEISGPELLSSREIAGLLAEAHGRPIEYREHTPEQRLAFWDAAGLPRQHDSESRSLPGAYPWSGHEMVSAEMAVARGFYAILSDHVEFITGQRPMPLHAILSQGTVAPKRS